MEEIMRKTLLLLCCALLAAACAKTASGPDMDSILDREWRLGYHGDKPVIDDSTVTVIFKEGGSLSGSAGCNSYSGSWEMKDGMLRMGPFNSTTVLCPDTLMKQEKRFLQHMQRATHMDLDNTGALLIFVKGETKPMLFRQ